MLMTWPIFVSDSKSAWKVFEMLDKFWLTSGLKVNKEKSEGLWLGQTRECKQKLYAIKWPCESWIL